MAAEPLTDRTLHVANGSCTTRLIAAAGLPGRTMEWADVLYEGPVPLLSDDALIVVRARHLTPAGGDVEATAAGLRAWRDTIAGAATSDPLLLWYEHDLFDQLNLVQLLAWLGGRRSGRPIEMIAIDRFPGHPAFKGFGELTASEIAGLVDSRRPVTGAQFALASTAWDALRAPTPDALDALRRGDTSALPFLAAAITRFLEEYPWTRDGLSRSERRLLQLAAEAPATLSTLFPRLHDGETCYFVTDRTLLATAERLGAGATPLLRLDGAADAGLGRTVAVTDGGQAAIRGSVDAVDACGLDAWRGGVHLRAADHWRWNAEDNRVIRG